MKPTPEPDFKKFYVSRVSDQTTPRESNLIETLLDTGSLAGNFVLRQVVNDLNLQADIITKTCTSTVCSALDNRCYDLTTTIPLKISYFFLSKINRIYISWPDRLEKENGWESFSY